MENGLTNQELNFEGGPWIVRDKLRIEYLSKSSTDNVMYHTKEYENLGWDEHGNAHNKFNWKELYPEFDIMESLLNWKYLRYHGYE